MIPWAIRWARCRRCWRRGSGRSGSAPLCSRPGLPVAPRAGDGRRQPGRFIPARHGAGSLAPLRPLGQPPGSVRPLPRQAGFRALLDQALGTISTTGCTRSRRRARWCSATRATGRPASTPTRRRWSGTSCRSERSHAGDPRHESDTLFPDAWAQWQLLQPAATFVEMDGVGHMLPIEAPVDMAVVVGHWLGDRGAMAQGRS